MYVLITLSLDYRFPNPAQDLVLAAPALLVKELTASWPPRPHSGD